MKVLIQRVAHAGVKVNRRTISEIGHGLLLFVGICRDDQDSDYHWMAEKVANLRIFEDGEKKLNFSIAQTKGEILSVPQFTLCANIKKGNRPGFDDAASPAVAKKAWLGFNNFLRDAGLPVKEGQFGSYMDVDIMNDGPVTFWIDSRSS